jgi:hypothetical protein
VAETPDNKGQEFLSRSFIKNQATRKENPLLESTLTKNIGVLGSLSKQIGLLNQNLAKMVKPTEKKKDFVRREDPMLKLYKSVDDLEELMRENNNLQKEKKKGMGMLGWVGALMGLGGLLGYLLTGKQEMLFSVVKALTKYSPLKLLLGGLDTVIKKSASLVMKPVIGLFKGIGHVFAPLGKLFGGTLAKEGAKAGAKGVGKSVLKKIPVVGALIGLFFGIQRFKKGDIVGGMLEIASGISSIIPGVGTAIGIAIDAFLLFRDFKKSPIEGGEKKSEGFKKMGVAALKSLPGIGTFIHFKEAMGLWKTDKLGAMKEIALALGSVVPGANLILDPVLSFVEGFIKSKGGIGKAAGQVLSSVSSVIKNPIGAVGSLFSKGKEAVGGMADKAITSVKEMPGKVLNKAVDASANMYNASEDFLNEGPGTEIGTEKESDQTGNGWFTFKKWKPKIQGLKSKVWEKFQGMAAEYKAKTGKSIQINSAVRNQKGSVHGVGQALDINSTNASELESMGLMEKWGFHRPLMGWKNETWHVEPYPGKEYGNRNTNNYPIRSAAAKGESELGFGGDILNLPQSTIANKTPSSTGTKIDLSDATIQSLAQAMGGSFRGAMPKSRANQVSIDTNMRG